MQIYHPPGPKHAPISVFGQRRLHETRWGSWLSARTPRRELYLAGVTAQRKFAFGIGRVSAHAVAITPDWKLFHDCAEEVVSGIGHR
jgi:hypothetical protein